MGNWGGGVRAEPDMPVRSYVTGYAYKYEEWQRKILRQLVQITDQLIAIRESLEQQLNEGKR